jgi:hypothetical protein
MKKLALTLLLGLAGCNCGSGESLDTDAGAGNSGAGHVGGGGSGGGGATGGGGGTNGGGSDAGVGCVLPEEPAFDWVSYWIALDGSDDNDCHTRQTACRTWSSVLERAAPEVGAVPIDIIFACGVYPAADEGPFYNTSVGVDLDGTAEAPVRIRSETPRCATLEGNGETVF